MVPISHALLSILSVLSVCLAQEYALLFSVSISSTLTTLSPPAPIADICLVPPKGSECNAIEDSYDAITLRIWSNFTRQCHNLNNLFNPSERQTSCPNDTCPGGVIPLQLDNWDSSSNFSRIYYDVYQPASSLGSNAYDPSRVTVRAYAGENCTDRVGVPWFQWGNCNVTVSDVCKEVGYDVMSGREWSVFDSCFSGSRCEGKVDLLWKCGCWCSCFCDGQPLLVHGYRRECDV